MKTRLIAVALVTMSAMVWMIAATLTVDIPTADVPRVSEAYGQLYQLGHNATMPEVAEQVKGWLMGQTKMYENLKYNRNYVEQPLAMQSPTPTPQPTPTP